MSAGAESSTTRTIALSYSEAAVVESMRVVRQTGRPGAIVLFVEVDGGVTIRLCEPPRRVRGTCSDGRGIDTGAT